MSALEVRALAAADRLDEAVARLRTSLASTPRAGRERCAWAELALEIGAATIARDELRLAVQEAPDEALIGDELRLLESELALACVGTSDQSVVAPIEADPAGEPLGEPSDADLIRFLHAFAGRDGVHARQWVDRERTGYGPVREPLTPTLLRQHLAGTQTLGTYLVRHDDTVVCFVLDLDLTKAALAAANSHDEVARLRALVHETGLALRERLAKLGLRCVLIDSGYKGRHLWGLLDAPVPAELVHHAVRMLAQALAPAARELALEAFPKQGKVEAGGLGNLVKLPLGVHRKSGRRATILDDQGQPLTDPWPLVRQPPRVSRDALVQAMSRLQPPLASMDDGRALSDDEVIDAHAELTALRRGCAVIDALIGRARAERRLTHDEQVVLAHSVGHLDDGPALVNGTFGHCPEIPRHAWLGRAFRGNPISCARVRQRIPSVTTRVACHCLFTDARAYPTPLLHLPRLAVT